MLVALVASVAAVSGPQDDGTGVVLISLIGTFALYFVYEVTCVAVWGRTLGKLILGLRVVRLDTGGHPGFRRALLRNLIPTAVLVLYFPLYPAVWMLALVGQHRWPNDQLAGTQVVRS